MADNLVIGVDVGGTKLLAGLVDPSGKVHETVERPTRTDSQEALLDEIAELVRQLPPSGAAAVGIGVPSRVDQRTGVVLGAVNIPIPQEVSFRSEMEKRIGLPVGLENDASAAAYAESRFGAGRDVETLLMLTLGTGVGGGVVSDGKLFRGWAELGHTVIVEDGEPCPGNCTGLGHVEAYCSGQAADIVARRVLGPNATAHDLVAEKHEALAAIGHHLGVAIGSLINIFNPEVVAIGGGFGVAAFDLLLPSARPAVVRDALAPAGENVEIRLAELGAEAGLIGAGLVAFDTVA
jgi:glucokinase